MSIIQTILDEIYSTGPYKKGKRVVRGMRDAAKRDLGLSREFDFTGARDDTDELMRVLEMMKAQEGAPQPPTGPQTVVKAIVPTIGSPIDGGSDYVEQAVDPREPWELEHEQNFANFKAMNPNLDWGAAAGQAGGNVPGGSFSTAERGDVPYEQTDAAFYDFVKNDLPRYEADRMLDNRSRAYNPEAAALLYDRLAQMEGQPAKDIYAAAQQMHGQAALGQVELAKRQMMMQNSPAGRASVLVDSLFNAIDSTVNPDIARKLIQAKVMISQGEVDNAMLLLQSLTDDTTNAGVPTVDASGIQR